MTPFIFNFFGKFEVIAADTSVTDFHSDKARALLAYLAIEPLQHTRRALAALLWPDIADKHALTNLRNTFYRLRQTLDNALPLASEQLFITTRQTIQCNTAQVTIDTLRFQLWLDQIVKQGDRKQAVSSDYVTELVDMVLLYQGELLAGFSTTDAAGFEEWLSLQREFLQERALLAFSTAVTTIEAAEAYDQGYEIAMRLLALDPYRENSYRQVMRLLAKMGQPNQALRQFDQMRQRFYEELAVTPSEETLALVKQIADGAFRQSAERWKGVDEQQIENREAGKQIDSTVGQRQERKGKDEEDDRSENSPVLVSQPFSTATDLTEMPMLGPFFGREDEQKQLEQWLRAGCRVVVILGIGGVGKTTLATGFVRGSSDNFDAILWRSLLNAPTLQELLSSLLQPLLGQPVCQLPENLDNQLRLLFGLLHEKHVLIVLDNLDSILDANRAGTFRTGYEAYGQLIQRIATYGHQSHFVFTSRERPYGYDLLESDSPLARSLPLDGLDTTAGRELLTQRGLYGMTDETVALIQRYSGNPLALKLVAETVTEIFDGNIGEFLDGFRASETLIFDDIRIVLDQQVGRLSPLEQEILYWLTIEREAISAFVLRQNLRYQPTQGDFIEALRSLQRRSLIERDATGFFLQSVVTEYLTDRLVKRACAELEQGDIDLLHHYPLVKATAKAYVRLTQSRMILSPVAGYLVARIGRKDLVTRLQAYLQQLRAQAPQQPSYLAGTILNLFLQLQIEMNCLDFSQLTIWQAYLRGAVLPGVNFANAAFHDVAFTDSFGDIRALAFSPSGEVIAAGTATGEIYLWQTSDTQLVTILRGHTAPIWSVTFSPDGMLLASGGADQMIHLWDLQEQALRTTLAGHGCIVRCALFSPDGEMLASSGDDRTVYLWDLQQQSIHTTLTDGHTESIRSLAFSPDGTLLATGSDDAKILLWELRSGQIQRTLAGHDGWVRSVAFSPDGMLLASGGDDQIVRLWELHDGNLKHQLHGHGSWLESIAFSPDGVLLASGGDDQTIRLWDVHNGKLLHTFSEHSGLINAIAFSPDGTILVSGDDDRNVYLWNVAARQLQYSLLGHTFAVNSVTFSPDGHILASGSGDHTVRFWVATTMEGTESVQYQPKGPPIHVGHVTVLAFHQDGATVASSGADRTILLLDVESGEIKQALNGHDGWVESIDFSPDGQLLASGSTDQTIKIWDIDRGELLDTLTGHAGWVHSVAFSPEGSLLASGGADGTVRFWEIENRQLYQTCAGHTGWVNSVAFSPNGEFLASASADGTVRLWNPQSGMEMALLNEHTGWVLSVAFSDDGRLLISGGHDRLINVWDISALYDIPEPSMPQEAAAATEEQGRIILYQVLQGHTHRITELATNPRLPILASSSENEVIRLWHLPSGEPLQTLRIPGPYEGMNIANTTGLSEAQKGTLKALGAVEESQ